MEIFIGLAVVGLILAGMTAFGALARRLDIDGIVLAPLAR